MLGLVSSVLCQEIGWEERLQNDLSYLEWDVKTSTESITRMIRTTIRCSGAGKIHIQQGNHRQHTLLPAFIIFYYYTARGRPSTSVSAPHIVIDNQPRAQFATTAYNGNVRHW